MASSVPIRESRVSVRVPAADVPIMAVASILLVYLAVVPVGTMLYASFQSGFLGTSAHWS
ncbi:MAG: hypothetical protein JO225_13825, partial [Candidatus Eremiobacteraeota bacterium]|nr:hypothetical protein [Candidatus Eremiobacteraeota bacterium]